jgi:hypothetical protein
MAVQSLEIPELVTRTHSITSQETLVVLFILVVATNRNRSLTHDLADNSSVSSFRDLAVPVVTLLSFYFVDSQRSDA